MDLRYLRYFVVVAEELNLTRAAERLNTAQPTLSVQIRRLETELGVDLFAREARGVVLTDAGLVFLEQARKLLGDAKRGVAMAQRAAVGEVGHLSIGHTYAAGFRVFPSIVPAFRKSRPDVHLAFHDVMPPQQIERLRRGELDLCFVWLPVHTNEFDIAALTEEPLVAALSANHSLARAVSVGIEDLSGDPLIFFSRQLDPSSFDEVEQAFARAGAPMNVAYELETLLSMISFVAMGCGYSILPDYMRSIPREGVVYKTLRNADVTKTLAIVKRKDASELVSAFFDFTVANIAAPRGRASRARS